MQLTDANIQIIVAFFAPLFVSIVKQTHWPNSVNGLFAIIVYIAFGLVAVVTSGQTFTLDNVVPVVTIFTTVGTVAYTAFWKNTALEPALTAATSINSTAASAVNRGGS